MLSPLRTFNKDFKEQREKKRENTTPQRVFTPTLLLFIIMALGTVLVTLYTLFCLTPMFTTMLGEFISAFGTKYMTKDHMPIHIVEKACIAPNVETLSGYGDIWSNDLDRFEEPQKYRYPDPEPLPKYYGIYHAVTESDRELMAKIVYLEAGTSSDKAMRAVASVIINRLGSGKMGGTIEEVIFYPKAFSTAKNVESCTPSERAYAAVDYVLVNGITLPKYVRYFRDWYHHRWDGYVGYCVIDGMYFGYMYGWERGKV